MILCHVRTTSRLDRITSGERATGTSIGGWMGTRAGPAFYHASAGNRTPPSQSLARHYTD
jgi:hypothetical protein